MADFTNDYTMGHCTVAANEYNDTHGGEYYFYVVRMLAPTRPNISKYESVPCAFFKENDKLNSHCFLRGRDGLITDPMYKLKDVNLKEYVSFMSKQLIPNRYYIMDIQDLNDKYRQENRAQFENRFPYFGVVYDCETDEMTLLED